MSIVERVVAAITAEDVVAFGSLYADGAVMYEPMLPEPARGRAAIVAGEESLFAAFGDIDVRVRGVCTSGRTVAAEVVLHATNDGPLDTGEGLVPATGRRIEVPMVWVFELDDAGLIAEERDYFDTATIMRQLGLAG